jgi:ABC-type branched-subunit amino acid transport system substrate-binding protein
MPPQGVKPEEVDPQRLLEDWRRQMDAMSRQREIEAWLIPIVLDGPAPVPPGNDAQYLEVVKAPRWRTRLAAVLTTVVVLGLISGGYASYGFADDHRHCGDGFTWLGLEKSTTAVTRVEGSCVGVTDGSNALLLPGSSFDEVRTKILSQNQQAVAVSKEQPYRPVITLVFLSSVADEATSESVLTSEREQLAGMAVAQAVQLAKPPQTYEPVVKILIANGGPRLKHGPLIAKQLGEMAAADPSIVAVVGLVESRESTAVTIRALAEAGLPTVAATLTADSMLAVSKLYFQISPLNAREAEVAAAHINDLLAKGKDPFGRPLGRSATIYQSDDPTDIYSRNLAADLKKSLAVRGIPAKILAFTPGGKTSAGNDAGTAGRDACDATGVVLYAARGLVDFPAFLLGIADRCRDRPPYVLAGDDATKYVADRVVSGANKSVPFQYLSLALAPELQGEVAPEASDFYAQLNDLFPYEKGGRGRTLDGHAALNYDAAYTVIVAVSYLRRDKVAINGGTVWSALQSVTDAAGAQRSYRGVTGKIDFGGTIGRRVPLDKPITIVTFRNGQPSARDNLVCGARTDPRTRPWCPTDTPGR